MICFAVRVVNLSNEPLENQEVHINLVMGGHTSEDTDEDGEAEFEIDPVLFGDGREVGIQVNGHQQGDYTLADRGSYTFTLDRVEI